MYSYLGTSPFLAIVIKFGCLCSAIKTFSPPPLSQGLSTCHAHSMYAFRNDFVQKYTYSYAATFCECLLCARFGGGARVWASKGEAIPYAYNAHFLRKCLFKRKTL